MKKIIDWIVLSCLLISGGVFYYSLPEDGDRLVNAVSVAIPKTVIISCVAVNEEGRAGVITGSGVFIDENGLVLTCAHLFNKYQILYINVTDSSGKDSMGTLVQLGERDDLALVTTAVSHKTPYAKIADPRKLKLGQEVFAIGNPLNLGLSVSLGIISGLYRDFPKFAYNVTQSDVAINPGNSGGPMFNLKGEVVGVVSFLMSANDLVAVFSGLGFSVQCGQIREFITLYKKGLKSGR